MMEDTQHNQLQVNNTEENSAPKATNETNTANTTTTTEESKANPEANANANADTDANANANADANAAASSSSWLGGWWSSASNAVNLAASTVTSTLENPTEIGRALEYAKTTTSNIVYHPEIIRDALVDVGIKAKEKASEVATMVEQRSLDLANTVLDKLDPMEDTIRLLDAVELSSVPADKLKVIVTSSNIVEFNSVVETYESFYGDRTYIRGCVTDSNVAAQPVGFEAALLGAQNRIDFLLNSDKFASTSTKGILVVSLQDFIVKLGDSWFSSVAIILYNLEAHKKCHAFTPLVPLPRSLVDTLMENSPVDYPHQATGVNVSVREQLVQKYPESKFDDLESFLTNNILNRAGNIITTLSLLIQRNLARDDRK